MLYFRFLSHLYLPSVFGSSYLFRLLSYFASQFMTQFLIGFVMRGADLMMPGLATLAGTLPALNLCNIIHFPAFFQPYFLPSILHSLLSCLIFPCDINFQMSPLCSFFNLHPVIKRVHFFRLTSQKALKAFLKERK